MTSEKIAIWEAFSGATAEDIAYAREALFKNRVGWEKILPYANAVFSSALMPFVLAICYIERKTYRHVLLFLFVLSLLPSLEKVLILKAVLPLVVLGLNGYFPRRRVIQMAAVTCVVVIGAFFLTKMGATDPNNEIRENVKILESHQGQLDVLSMDASEKVQTFSSKLTPGYKGSEPLQVQRRQHKALLKDAREKLAVFRPKLERYRSEKSDRANAAASGIEAEIEYYGNRLPEQIEKEERAIRKVIIAERLWIESQIEFYGSRLPKQIKYEEKGIRVQMESLRMQELKLNKYHILGPGRLMFIANRIFWIPYVTAYDWVGYFHEELEGKYLSGKTSGLIARISGQAQFPMEREVFKYQFGGSELQTAAANASFLVDAFVNFGWIGVVIYAAIFALLTRIVVVQGNPAMMACYYYFVFQVSMGGLSGVLFSNGMIVLIFVAFFVRPKLNLVAH